MGDHRWERCIGRSVPHLAVLAGHDSDGDAIYVGRAEYDGEVLPAKVIPHKGKGYICHGGREIELHDFEVLSGLHYDWVPDSNGSVPPTAVKVGRADDGDFLYAGRGHWEGSLSVGKIHPSHGCLYIPYGGEEIKLHQYDVLVSPAKWLESSGGSLPDGAVEGGHDADGDAIFVGRVNYHGDLMAAKVVPNKGGAYVAYGSAEHKVDNYEVLVGHGYLWTGCSDGNIVPGAVPTGNSNSGETLYVGRAHHGGSLTVGKVHPSHGCIYVPFDGKEIKLDSYEVLVKI